MIECSARVRKLLDMFERDRLAFDAAVSAADESGCEEEPALSVGELDLS